MRTLLPIIALVLLAFAVSVASAEGWYYGDDGEAAAGPQQGAKEVSIAGTYLLDSGSDEDDWMLFARGGYFFTDQIEFGVTFWGNDDIQNVVGFGAYHIAKPGATVVPYLTAGAGYRFVDTAGSSAFSAQASGPIDDDDFLWTVGGGLKYYVSPEANLFLEYIYADTQDTNLEQDSLILGISKVFH